MTFRSLTPSRFALTLGLAALGGAGAFGPARQASAQTSATPPAAAAPTVPAPTTPNAAPAASPTTPAEIPSPAKSDSKRGGGHHGSQALNRYLTNLHDSLKITAAEEPLWGKFADVMRNNAADLAAAYRARRDQLPGMTATEDMNSFIAVEQKRLDDLKQSAAAFTELYNAMPADQQKVADKLFLSDLPGGPHRHPGHKGPHKMAAPAKGDNAGGTDGTAQ